MQNAAQLFFGGGGGCQMNVGCLMDGKFDDVNPILKDCFVQQQKVRVWKFVIWEHIGEVDQARREIHLNEFFARWNKFN